MGRCPTAADSELLSLDPAGRCHECTEMDPASYLLCPAGETEAHFPFPGL